MNAIKIENISKRFGDFYAVKHLSFTIPEGTIYSLLGPNGAGKTTTIRMVMNIIIPDEGSIRILDQKMDEDMKKRIGYLPEDRGLYPKMKVGELLLFLAELKALQRQEARKRIDNWLERFELAEWKFKKVEELSRGMQQKIQFIATVIHEPDLIILDEPFGGLDPVNTKLLKDIMLEMKQKGRTIIFSTHRMEQVEMISDKICLINKAERVLEGDLNQIKQQYGKNTVILDYVGEASFIKGLPEVEKIDDYGKFMEIKMKEQSDPQDLLNKLVDKIRINKFEVREPTLNAIFIEKVGDKNAQDTVSH
ncbi:MAG: ATP-binding cassette domain-containing protein [Candidatus Aminicenantes bacterium]|jgi:ABC-2 type transport system ATP-binding protein|nr:ATP-binding cassette domain-containing protein [Candidatus Aminicenantes bacterium]MDH5383753.1 ATP-binding cassette domain-containing protein [Candidatus Aminicenantes bacterium]MDH5742332.1 ATP-binding cassette domain-containing protein [Candidatus Aminicenantes bacterium]